jgi:hypothetical protein
LRNRFSGSIIPAVFPTAVFRSFSVPAQARGGCATAS